MGKLSLLAALLLISAVCLQASAAGAGSDKSHKPSGPTSVQGCLTLSRGQYFLTESDGTLHMLSGAANKLGPHVGHTVELTGKPGTRTEDTTSAGVASAANEYPVFEVKTVTHVADTCKMAAH
jgi:hypothetical protein